MDSFWRTTLDVAYDTGMVNKPPPHVEAIKCKLYGRDYGIWSAVEDLLFCAACSP